MLPKISSHTFAVPVPRTSPIKRSPATKSALTPVTSNTSHARPLLLQLQKTIGNRATQQLLASQTATLQKQHPIQRAKTLNDAGMETLADELAPSSQGTVAVAKNGATYLVFSQSNIGSQKDILDDYTNVQMGVEGDGKPKGYHAEMRAIDSGLTWTHIAANNPVCIRCERALAAHGKTPVNRGGHYTKDWLAPDANADVGVASTFPGKAQKDKSMNGQTGTRYTKAGGNLFSIAKSVWGMQHPAGW